jgi:hypothetical protein
MCGCVRTLVFILPFKMMLLIRKIAICLNKFLGGMDDKPAITSMCDFMYNLM